MNPDGSGKRALLEPRDLLPFWSPDGRMISFSRRHNGNYQIFVMNADGSGQRNLTREQGDDFRGAWSPDGRKIAFVTRRDGNWAVYVMNPDGSGQRRLTRDGS